MDIINQFVDKLEEGIIILNKLGEVEVYNRKAKEIFGIENDYLVGHNGGVIENGDIVVISNNEVGRDDGGMDAYDFKSLGIEENVESGDGLLYIGVYGGSPMSMKRIAKEKQEGLVSIEKIIKGIKLISAIDFDGKNLKILIGDKEFKLNYYFGLGHLVILDKEMNIKFYQERGFTVRKESLKEILSGNRFREKNVYRDEIELHGKKILEIHEVNPPIGEFIAAAKGEESIDFDNIFFEINGRPTLCTLKKIFSSFEGAFLKINDLSEVCRLKDERNKVQSQLEGHIKRSDEMSLAMDMFSEYIGEDVSVRNLKYMAYRASLIDSNLLITGKSGTGKNLLAELIHRNSKRKNNSFVHVNCAAIPESLIESELFGYEKGAFSGALNTGKKGLLEMADGGTLFLDEIGELSYPMQAKLLEVIQDKSFFRISGINKVKVNFRLICATNKDLVSEVKSGEFREDLYYRINVISIKVPQLKERKSDIDALVKSIIEARFPSKNYMLTDEFSDFLKKYDFPGNIRELENILERSIAMSEGNILDIDEEFNNIIQEASNKNLKELLESYERKVIKNYLKMYEGDKKKVMELLGLKKTAFYDKLKKYKIPK